MKLTHPDAKKPIEVRSDQVEIYESQGWSKVEPTAKPAEDKSSK